MTDNRKNGTLTMEENNDRQASDVQRNLANWFPEQQPQEDGENDLNSATKKPDDQMRAAESQEEAPHANQEIPLEEPPQATPGNQVQASPDTADIPPEDACTSPEDEAPVVPEVPEVPVVPEVPAAPVLRTEELPLQQPKEIITFHMPDQPFAKIIQQIRLDAEVSIKEVSDKTRISATFINDLEQENYQALPSLNLCLAKIEQLCLEYDVDSQALIERFTEEYHEHKKADADHIQAHLSYSFGKHGPGSYMQPKPSRMPGLPAIFIGTVLILLIGLLSYAFYAYHSHQMPERMDSDLTEHIPIHEPKIYYLDELKR